MSAKNEEGYASCPLYSYRTTDTIWVELCVDVGMYVGTSYMRKAGDGRRAFHAYIYLGPIQTQLIHIIHALSITIYTARWMDVSSSSSASMSSPSELPSFSSPYI